LKPIKGLGGALQRKILQGIEIGRQAQGRRHLHRAAALLRAAERSLRESHLGLKRTTPAGDFRRGCELVGELSLVAEASDLNQPVERLKASPQLTVHLAIAATMASRY
jgi:DNA polymerase (family X)